MKKWLPVVLTLCLCWTAFGSNLDNELVWKPIPAGFELTPGTYELSWDPEIPVTGPMRMRFADEEAKAKVKELPSLKSTKPRIELYSLDGTKTEGLIAIVYDESQGTDTGYDTAYIDTNRNLDLSDEQPVQWSMPTHGARSTPPQYGRVYSPWVTVQARQGPAGAEQTRHPVHIRVQAMDYAGDFMLIPERKGAWRGVIRSTAGEIPCASVDLNMNGVFGDHMENADDFTPGGATHDALFADTNGAGKIIFQTYGSHIIPMSDPVLLAGKLYRFTSSKTGDTITIDKFTGPTGKLIIEVPEINGLSGIVVGMMIAGKRSFYRVSEQGGKPLDLAVGKYRIFKLDLELKSEAGTAWVSCLTDQTLEISEGKQTALKIGGEITTAINPRDKDLTLAPNRSVTVSWVMKIGGIATVQSVMDKSPKVKFLDQAGELAGETTSSYG